MRKSFYIINLQLLIVTAVVAFIGLFGLSGMLALGIIQPVCAIIYCIQWHRLSELGKRHLRLYLYLLAIAIVIMAAIPIYDAVNFNLKRDLEVLLGLFALIAGSSMAIYFTYIAYLISKDEVKRITK